jgi:hypothetical protein
MTSNYRTTQKLVLLTTTDNKPESMDKALRMIATVQSYLDGGNAIETKSFLLLQRSTPQAEEELRQKLPAFVTLKAIPDRVSLSRARNILLGSDLAGAVIEPDDIVGFPDDDCWFPAGIIAHLVSSFTSRPDLDLWFCRYGSDAAFTGTPAESKPALQTIIARASSNTTYYRGRVILSVGSFDENLGVGAPYNGGEDTDYALRASYVARATSFLDAKVIGHRDMFQELKGRYYVGTLIALWKSAYKSLPGRWALARKLLVGVVLVAKGQLTPRDFLQAIGIAAKLAGKRPA